MHSFIPARSCGEKKKKKRKAAASFLNLFSAQEFTLAFSLIFPKEERGEGKGPGKCTEGFSPTGRFRGKKEGGKKRETRDLSQPHRMVRRHGWADRVQKRGEGKKKKTPRPPRRREIPTAVEKGEEGGTQPAGPICMCGPVGGIKKKGGRRERPDLVVFVDSEPVKKKGEESFRPKKLGAKGEKKGGGTRRFTIRSFFA